MNQPELKTGEPGKFGGECAIRRRQRPNPHPAGKRTAAQLIRSNRMGVDRGDFEGRAGALIRKTTGSGIERINPGLSATRTAWNHTYDNFALVECGHFALRSESNSRVTKSLADSIAEGAQKSQNTRSA